MNEANERQVGGQHYAAPFQHWDFVEFVNLGYLPAQVTKYVCRWKKKNGLQDLQKAAHFLAKFIETEKLRVTTVQRFANNFVNSNELGMEERQIVMLIAQHHCSTITLLEMAERALFRLMTVEQDRLSTASLPETNQETKQG